MEQIDKAVELYELMAARCLRNGLSPKQAEVYSEMAELCSGCRDIDEATAAIKNSKYYLAPTEALVRDKIGAELRAAKENDMPELVDVYEDKLAAIDRDQGEMYTAGFEATAQNIKKDYMLTMQAFAELYRCYFSYISDGKDTYINEIKMNLTYLKKPSSDFEELARIPRFRSLIICNDEGYACFVRDIKEIISGRLPVRSYDQYSYDDIQDHDEAWKEVCANKEAIIKAGREHTRFTDMSYAVAVPPSVQEYEENKAKGIKSEYKFEEVR